MALDRFEKDMKIIQALDDEPNDVGGLTPTQLKSAFDEGGEALKEYLNETLLPQLEALGVEAMILLPQNAGFKYMRLNGDKVLETSTDGEAWEASGSSGHIIVNAAGSVLAQRGRMKFADMDVSDDGIQTVIYGRGPRGYPANVNGKMPDETGNITLSAEDVGAAPNGYGLGEPSGKYIEDCDAAARNGWYDTDGNTLNVPENAGAENGGTLLNMARGEKSATQIWAPSDFAARPYLLIRKEMNGAFSAWEWLNPPMFSGVEYRTTERYLNVPVYCKLIDAGYIPAGTSSISHAITGIVDAVDIRMINTHEAVTHYSGVSDLTFNAAGVHITSANAFGSVQFVLKYTK